MTKIQALSKDFNPTKSGIILEEKENNTDQINLIKFGDVDSKI